MSTPECSCSQKEEEEEMSNMCDMGLCCFGGKRRMFNEKTYLDVGSSIKTNLVFHHLAHKEKNVSLRGAIRRIICLQSVPRAQS
jgi:hypothetical protein